MGTVSMIKMKIGSKLLLTYFLLIFSIFMITSISFRFISQRYLIHETEQQLQKDAKVMSQLLSKVSLSNDLVQKKLANERAFTFSERLLSSKMIIWRADQEIVYTDMGNVSLDHVMDKSKGPDRKFVTKTESIIAKNGKIKGYVTLVASLRDINNINGMMRKSQLVSLVISALIALFLGIFFKNSLTKPIHLLMEQMRNFSLKEANKEISIKTNDEIGELADSFQALTRKLKQYDEDQKMFFHNASHELKTPLMAIQGNAEGILDGVVCGDEIEKSLQVIIAESQRLKKIVEGITYLAKLENVEESFSFSSESLDAVIREAVQSVKSLAEQKGLDIKVDIRVFEAVLMDKEKMKRAFINLLGNAIRYAESIIVVAAIQQESEREVTIEIRDDGRGLAPEESQKIFQRFYSGEDGGSGIGLAITKAIIEAHHGTITACNSEEGGAVFQIRCPLKR
jgi:signal transduction histidine kinase